MMTNNQTSQNFLVVFAFFLFILGLYLGNTIWSIDQDNAIAEMISCNNYEEEFLKEAGFIDREDCKQLNLALYRQYSENCTDEIKLSGREDVDLGFINSCIYHKFAKNNVVIASEYYSYIKSSSHE